MPLAIMSLSVSNHFLLLQTPRRRWSAPCVSASLDLGVKNEDNTTSLNYKGHKETVRKMFDRVDISVSSYDTAWVAMVPSPNSPEGPCFPKCVAWLLDNQLHDGSWGLLHHHPLLIKDRLLSTLACVLALKRWGVGEEQIKKGLHFIKSNFDFAIDEKQLSPTGFDIMFPGMVEYAKDLHIDLTLDATHLNSLIYKRDLALTEGSGSYLDGRKAYLAYLSEGMVKLQNWEMVMKYQRSNGSLFNSPATTASAFIQLKNYECLEYLHSLLNAFENAVPTVYPVDIYAHLCLVDVIIKMGIDRHYSSEIKSVLDTTYKCWLQREEVIFLDIVTCSMAFRLLRVNGYDVSPDAIAEALRDHGLELFTGQLNDVNTVLELYRASEINMYPDESVLENINSWSRKFLKEKCLYDSNPTHNGPSKYLRLEVDLALKLPFCANLERLGNRKYIELPHKDNIRILKTAYSFSNIDTEEILKLAVEDFNNCQLVQQEEVEQLGRWVIAYRLDQLKFARQKLAYCYFSAAATLYPPELSDARISWAKNGVLTTVVDDFFDVGGSKEELDNLIHLVEKWDVNMSDDCISEEVGIIFLALKDTIYEIEENAFTYQGHSVRNHVIEIWLDLLRSMHRESEWLRNKYVPTLDEYISNGLVSFALGPILLPALYLVGPRLSEEVIKTTEYHNLYKHTSTLGRLLNDFRGYKREAEEGKLNALSLRIIHHEGTTEGEAIRDMKANIESNRRELTRLVFQTWDSVIPRACKDLFLKMSKVLHLFYMNHDGFTSNDMFNVVNAVLHEPISLQNTGDEC